MTTKDTEQFFESARENMVKNQIMPYGVADENILDAILTTPKHEFIEKKSRNFVAFLKITISLSLL